MLHQTWLDQWARARRRLDDLRAVYAGAPGGTTAAVDATLSFFESVHHLKDWIGNDPSVILTRPECDALIEVNVDLQLCADLANGSKHLLLTTSRTGDSSTSITRNDAVVFVGTGTSAHRFYVASGGAEQDALGVAERAVETWTAFLSAEGLLPPASPRSTAERSD